MQLFTEEFVENAMMQERYDNGLSDGIQLGTLKALFGLVRKGRLDPSEASDEAGLSLDDFNAKLAEYDRGREDD